MAAQEAAKLRGGPYRAPRCYLGDLLECQIGGLQIVCGFTDASVSWPYYYCPNRSPRLFICGDLARAIQNEAATVIAPIFGTSDASIARWRSKLGIQVPCGFPRRVSDETVAAIRARAAAGEKHAAIARNFGVSEIYVWNLARNRRRISSPGDANDALAAISQI